MSDQEDNFLWDDFRKGDKKAFQSIYQKYAPALLNYGGRITADTSLTEDSIQDLFVELWKSGEKLSCTTSIKFYLFKALRSKIIRNLKASHSMEMVSIEGFMTVLRSPSQESYQVQLEAASFQIQHLKQTLERLPARQREAINLRYFHHFSNEEISQMMGITYQSACKFIYAGLKTLRENLKVAVSIVFGIICAYPMDLKNIF
jgi:RNA polymerase sigma factor (sigma-70 family)